MHIVIKNNLKQVQNFIFAPSISLLEILISIFHKKSSGVKVRSTYVTINKIVISFYFIRPHSNIREAKKNS